MTGIAKRIAAVAALSAATGAWACTGTVTLGEGTSQVTTSVANQSVGGVCMNALIADTVVEGANYANEAEFLVAVAKLAAGWRSQGLIDLRQYVELIRGSLSSQVGRTVTVRVIGFNDFHGNLQSPGTFGVNTSVPPANRPAVGGAESTWWWVPATSSAPLR
jgi:hypothetical protein